MQDQDFIIKIAVLAGYVGVLFLIGILASRRIKSMSDYYVGGKKMGFWAVAFSARATGESGWLLIGLTGMGAIAGFSAYWVVLGELLGVFVSWQFMAKRFKHRSDEYKAITIPDYLQSHFKSSTNTLRIISASILVVFVVIYVASQMDVTGIAFESMLNIDYRIGALIWLFHCVGIHLCRWICGCGMVGYVSRNFDVLRFSTTSYCGLVLYGSWRWNY